MKQFFHTLHSVILITTLGIINPAQADEENVELANSLALLTLSARAVLVDNKRMIMNPTRNSISAESFVQKTLEKYSSNNGPELDHDQPLISALLNSITTIVTNAKNGAYKGRWVNHKRAFKFYENRFLPARFAELLAEEFTRQSNNRAIAKLTVPDDFLSIIRDGDENKSTRADSWEQEMLSNDSSEGELLTQRATIEGRDAYRYLKKEYYTSGCLLCHGGEAGERLHMGKKPGEEGDVGGAISLIIFD